MRARRSGGRTDDFSNWLECYGADPSLVARLRAIDVYFLNLYQLRDQMVEAFREHSPNPDVVLKASA